MQRFSGPSNRRDAYDDGLRHMQNKRVKNVGMSLGLVALLASGNPFGLALVGMGAIALTTPSVHAAVLTSWRFDSAARQLEFTVPEGTTPRYFLVAQPARIVLDLPNTTVGNVPEQQTYSGVIRAIRVGQFQPGVTRIVIELAPNTVFAAGQVELRQVNAGGRGDRWILRPLLADRDSSTLATAPAPAPTPASPPSDRGASAPLPRLTPAQPVRPSPIPSSSATALSLEQQSSTAAAIAASPTPIPVIDSSQPTVLPPLEPNAVEIPIQPAPSPRVSPSATAIAPVLPASPPEVAPSPEPSGLSSQPSPEPSAVAFPSPVTPAAVASSPIPLPSPTTVVGTAAPSGTAVPPSSPTPTSTQPSAAAPVADVAPVVPPVTPAPTVAIAPGAPEPQPLPLPSAERSIPAVPLTNPPATLPQLGQISQPPPVIQSPATLSTAELPLLPPATLTPSPAPVTVTVPPPTVAPLPNQDNTAGAAATINQLPPQSAFQALPNLDTDSSNLSFTVAATSGVLLPAGTVLKLRYPGSDALELSRDRTYQDVLLIAQAIRDRAGNIIVQEGSQVIGRFETGREGSQFVAQALSMQGRNVLINGRSASLTGDRQIPNDRLIRNSALGAVGLAVLGGLTGIGLLGGAAVGAAATYLSAPQAAIIQPNQIVEVRLSEDVPQ